MTKERPAPGRGRGPAEGGPGPREAAGPGREAPRGGAGRAAPRTGWLLVGLGTHLAAMTVTGFLLGFFLDGWLGTRPALMLLLGGLGFVGGVLRAHRTLSRWGG